MNKSSDANPIIVSRWFRFLILPFAILIIGLSGAGLWFLSGALREYHQATPRMIELDATVINVEKHRLGTPGSRNILISFLFYRYVLYVKYEINGERKDAKIDSLVDKPLGAVIKIKLDPAEKVAARLAEPLPWKENILWWLLLGLLCVLPCCIFLFGAWLIYRVFTVPLPKTQSP